MTTTATATSPLGFDLFCNGIELWKGCILAGIFSMTTSIFDLMWSTAHMINEDDPTLFYILFSLGIESVWFILFTGVLFTALIRKSRLLLLPWMFMVFVDITLNMLVAFAELSLPSNLSSRACSLPVVSTLISVLVCMVMIYGWIWVYAQYMVYSKGGGGGQCQVSPLTSSNAMDGNHTITIVPAQHHDRWRNASFSGSLPQPDNRLQVPQASTPKDAW